MLGPRLRGVISLCAAAVIVSPGHVVAADGDMPLGAPTAPPLGYVELCARLPALCVQNAHASPSQIDAVSRWAGQMRWTIIFARSLGIPNPPVASQPPQDHPTGLIPPPTDLAAPALPAASTTFPAPSLPSATVPVQFWLPPATNPMPAMPAMRWNLAARARPSLVVTTPSFSTSMTSSPAPGPVTFQGDGRAEQAGWSPPRFSVGLEIDQLNAINRRINRDIRPTNDLAAFGQVEYWTLPQGVHPLGDCEDYVLAKRQALLAAGAPAESLSIAVVRTRSRELHTVLLVATPEGEIVLDNLSPWILPWRDAPYEWRERQAPGSALAWVNGPA